MSWACEVVFPTCKPQGNSSQGADPHSLILNLPRFQPVTGTSEIRWIRWIWATDSNAVNTLTVIRAFSELQLFCDRNIRGHRSAQQM